MVWFPAFGRDDRDFRPVQIQDDTIGVEPFDPPNLRLIAFGPGSGDGPIQIERDSLIHLDDRGETKFFMQIEIFRLRSAECRQIF